MESVEIRERNVCAYPWQQMNIDLTGEVVPCCYWSGYGNAGKPLGNTNENSIEEIWNGPAYRELRRANATGELKGHPCHECLAWKWAGHRYPDFSWPSFRQETGQAWVVSIPERFRQQVEGAVEPVLLYEDGVPLPFPDAVHDHIREQGAGRYSIWGDTLYFSATDNSDPRSNGKQYELVCGDIRRKLASVVKDSDSGRNLFQAYDEYSQGAEVMEAKPTMLSFIATSDCNIDCPGCSQNLVRLLRVQHRAETELDVLEHVKYLLQFIWHGGEPYLIKRFREFVDSFRTADNPNLTFGFTSNGTLLSVEELAKLDKFPAVNASISMDSFVEDTFHDIRAGANFQHVLRNTLRAVETYDAPDRVFSVGMIINKKNMLELPVNVQFAMQHGIGMNLSPVVVVPVHDRLDIFNNFQIQTAGWRQAIDEARAAVDRARAAGAAALKRIDPIGMLEALSDILEQARARYHDAFELTVQVSDPHGSLAAMHNPGVIVSRHGQHHRPLGYVSLRTAGTHQMQLPRAEMFAELPLSWSFVHDLDEPMGNLDGDSFRDENGAHVCSSGSRQFPAILNLDVPSWQPVARERKNIKVANFGLPTPDGLAVADSNSMFEAYVVMRNLEWAAGKGRILDEKVSADSSDSVASFMSKRASSLYARRHTSFVKL